MRKIDFNYEHDFAEYFHQLDSYKQEEIILMLRHEKKEPTRGCDGKEFPCNDYWPIGDREKYIALCQVSKNIESGQTVYVVMLGDGYGHDSIEEIFKDKWQAEIYIKQEDEKGRQRMLKNGFKPEEYTSNNWIDDYKLKG